MIKIYEDEKRIMYKEDKEDKSYSIYTMMDMGNYIGHFYRDTFSKPKSEWRLMFKDDFDSNNDKIRHTETLVDSIGYYSRFLENNIKDNTTRCILCENEVIEEDSISDNDTDMTIKTMYERDRFDKEKPQITLNDYLASNENDDNKRIIDYLNTNSLLKREINIKRGL